MVAHVTLQADHPFNIEFYVGEDPKRKYADRIYPGYIIEIYIDGHELDHAINVLGAANVKGRSARYYGDEARRIFFNWTNKLPTVEAVEITDQMVTAKAEALFDVWQQTVNTVTGNYCQKLEYLRGDHLQAWKDVARSLLEARTE